MKKYYLFGSGKNVSFINNLDNIPEKYHSEVVKIVNELPEEIEEKEGFSTELYLDPDTKELSWIYEEKPEWLKNNVVQE